MEWSDGSTDNPYTICIEGNMDITAIFERDKYQLNIGEIVGNGTIRGVGQHSGGEEVIVEAIPAEHYHFSGWGDSEGTTENPRRILMTKDTAISAYFEEDEKYTITVYSNDTNMGTVSGGGEYYANENYQIYAMPKPNHHFNMWSDLATSNPRIIPLKKDTIITAYFEEDDKYTITVYSNDTNMGTVRGGGVYYVNEYHKVYAMPKPNHHFLMWSDGFSSNPRSRVTLQDVEYVAIFEPDNTTGVDECIQNSLYKVAVYDREIVVSGVKGKSVAVYNVLGVLVNSVNKAEEQFSTTVQSGGVYLIKIEGMKTRKIIVK